MSEQHNPPAFPVHGGYDGDDPRNCILGGGMSLRDYFAAQCLPALVERLRIDRPWSCVTTAAYEIADEMLRVREKK